MWRAGRRGKSPAASAARARHEQQHRALADPGRRDNGAIYALLALALLLVFAVTRIIFVPQGDFISYAGLTLGTLQLGQVPGTVYLLVGGGAIVAAIEATAALRAGKAARLPRIAALHLGVPLAIAALAAWAAPRKLGPALQMALTLAIVVPLGPMLYRIAYRPLANASVLVLFIVSMAAHYVLTGLGLVIFGGEGLRSNTISDAKFDVGVLHIGAQSLWVVGGEPGLHDRAVAVLRAHALRQGAARDGDQPHRRAARRHPDRARRTPRVRRSPRRSVRCRAS